MTRKKGTRGKASFAVLAESVEGLRALQREFGMPDELVDDMLREAEDGLAMGLGAVPPAYPAKFGLDARARVSLMTGLSRVAQAMHERVAAVAARKQVARAA